MKTTTILVCLGFAATACTPAARPTSPAVAVAPTADDPDVRAIEAVLLEFQRAIIAHDGAALDALWLSPDVPFRSRRLATGKLSGSTGAEFARDMAGGTGMEERFTDVVITPRDGLAILDSRYSFHANGVMTNHGREIWVLIQTDGGWKIASVTWSVESD